MMKNNSPHILNTSANLLGFSFLVLSSIKSFGLPQVSHLDEIVAMSVIIFALSTLFSFISMRSKHTIDSEYYEKIADYIFLSGLCLVTITALFLSMDIIISVK